MSTWTRWKFDFGESRLDQIEPRTMLGFMHIIFEAPQRDELDAAVRLNVGNDVAFGKC
jgi:hypothetical protein